MAIRKCKRPQSTFNMSSMTDVVFLLLIFFMVTSTLVNPNALKLVLPKSTNQTENNVFYLNAKVTPFSQLERQIIDILKDTEDPCISIEAEKSVAIEQVVRVMNIAKNNNFRSILATQPE